VTGNENGHGKAKGHDKGRQDHRDSAGDTPVASAATPLVTPAPSGTAPDEAGVAETPEAPTQAGSSDGRGPDDRGHNGDGGNGGNGEHGHNGGD